jgi:hypothetical protein
VKEGVPASQPQRGGQGIGSALEVVRAKVHLCPLQASFDIRLA